jgi:hypothetical protein
MHFLFVLLRLLLDRLVPAWRDGLTMAARADGRVEQLPSWNGRWLRWWRDPPAGRFFSREKVRSGGDAARRACPDPR